MMNNAVESSGVNLPGVLKTTLTLMPVSPLALHAMEVRADELPLIMRKHMKKLPIQQLK